MSEHVEFASEYLECIHDLADHPLIRSMRNYVSHGQTTCLEHCLAVSYRSFCLSRRLGQDARCAARAGLLHDFYLYDWHDGHDYSGLHGFRHPSIALRNARAHFAVSDAEADAIACHMWPLTLRPPKTRLGWVICLADKLCAVSEILRIQERCELSE